MSHPPPAHRVPPTRPRLQHSRQRAPRNPRPNMHGVYNSPTSGFRRAKFDVLAHALLIMDRYIGNGVAPTIEIHKRGRRGMIQPSVLVVEDEEDIRELVSYNLLKEGYQVAGVASGEEALAERPIAAARPDAAGPDASRHRWVDGLPQAEGQPQDDSRSRSHVDGQGRRGRHRGRPEPGGRRLHHQALQPQGVAGPGAGGAAPRPTADGRRTMQGSESRSRSTS